MGTPAPAAAGTAIPVPRSRLFGRVEEIAAVLALFRGGARLVTITGAGGIGKTRVALEVAQQTAEPVEFVGLAGADEAGFLAGLVRSLAPAAPAGRPALEAISDRLAGSHSVLVLDTFEHLIGSANQLAVLLDSCPDLRLLVTSRARLRLDGEQIVRLAPLAAGPDGPAAAMFRERARAVGGDAGEDDAETVDALCVLLDGVPLAIELAAARTTLLSPRALVERLGRSASGKKLDVLSRGPADAAPRHQSMRATVEWSCVLLEPQTQLVFRRCGAFAGSFSLEAAETVCGGDVLDPLAALVDLHLLEPVDGPDAAPRFRMLDALREYAIELLDTDPDAAAAHDRLVDWCLDFGHEAGAGLVSGAEHTWLERVAAELPLLRTALQRLADRHGVRGGAVLASQLAPFWVNRGPMTEGRGWLRTFLEPHPSSDGLSEHERAVATAWAARMSLDEGDLGPIEQIEQARAVISQTPADVGQWLQVTEHLAYGLTLCGELTRADELTAEAIELARRSGEIYWLAVFLQRRALSAQRHSEPLLAMGYAQETVRVAMSIGYERVAARAEQILAHVQATELGPQGAYRALEANLRALEAAGDRRGVVSAMASLGAVCEDGDAPLAARWYRDGLDEAQRIGYWHGEAFCVLGMASAAALSGHLAAAASLDAALQPHMAVLKAGIPPTHFESYQALMERVRVTMGAAFDDARRSAPIQWPAVRTRAREVAHQLGASTARKTGAGKAGRQAGPRVPSKLTARELQILVAISNGRTNPQIAAEFSLSPKTVMHHSTSVYRKLGVRGRAEAVAHAYRSGMLTVGHSGAVASTS